MLVALTGKKRSGKSTAAKYLEGKYNLKRINFKDGLVRELKDRMGDHLHEIAEVMEKVAYEPMKPWTIERLFEEKPPLMRTLLQTYGTNVRRIDDENYWVNEWKGECSLYVPDHTTVIGSGVVVDDVRFLNEAQAIRDKNGIIIRIKRQGLDSNDTHLSETQMDLIEPDHTITVEDGDLDGLYRALDEILHESMR